jgi:hypothetical protein
MVEAKGSLTSEVDLCHLVLRSDEAGPANLRVQVSSRVQVYDCFIDESLVARVEKVSEVFLELPEYQIYNLGLHFWR